MKKKLLDISSKNKDLKVPISLRLFSCQIPLTKALNFEEKEIILEQPIDQEVQIYISEQIVAKGILLVEDGCYAVKITHIF